MSYAVGSLVRARGREWVVLPDSSEDMLVLRPLAGTDDEIAGVYTALEAVESAQERGTHKALEGFGASDRPIKLRQAKFF